MKILDCPFCGKAPNVASEGRQSVCFVECCGVHVIGATVPGAQRRWNEIARAVEERRFDQINRRMMKKAGTHDRG